MPSENPAPPETLSAELRDQLLARVSERLQGGEVLVSTGHFVKAFEEEYLQLKGQDPTAELRAQFGSTIEEINRKNPEVLVVLGVENWLVKAFMEGVRKNNWDIVAFQEQGHQALRDFIRQDRVKAVMSQLQVQPAQLNLRRCLRIAGNQVAGKAAQVPKRNARLDQLGGAPAERVEHLPENLKLFLSGPAAEPSAAEIEERTQEEQRRQDEIRASQLDHLFQNLSSYVAEGKMEQEEADRFTKVYQIDRAVKAGKISREQGGKVRNSLLAGNVRFEFDRKIKAVTDYAVTYLQLFAALKRIEPKYDEALRFLISFKEVANAEKEEFDPTPVTNALIEDFERLKNLSAIMDRQDAEVRMMMAGLPPYSQVMRKGQEQRIERLTVEPGFVDQLRQLPREEMAGRLNAADKMVRVRAAADMLCLVALINRLVKPTPFRKEIRLLKINMIIEEFYRTTEDLSAARGKAQKFLKARLRVIYPDITADEFQEIEEKSTEIIDRVEQRVLAQRQEQARAAKAAAEGEKDLNLQESLELSPREIARGAQVGRVSLKVGNSWRMVPLKVMPDADEPERFVLVHRDAQSRELVPVAYRGGRCYVTKNKSGIWDLS
ncbi:MAG: hypothetical protein IT369_06370 [Candidatus Latescibacteria bacterium]|nr:hypothetical protein [Candidatus Latescibacterota bacterium]